MVADMVDHHDAFRNPHSSPTLEQFRDNFGIEDPEIEIACRDCPAGIWYATGNAIEDLTCFCTAMHRPTWDLKIKERGEAVLLCDAREGAIAEMIAEPA